MSAAATQSVPSAKNSDVRSLPALSGVSWLEALPLSDGELAFITSPVGAREPRPMMVAVHGAGDRPEWACGGWRLAASEYAFVVCPRGLPMDAQRFAWDQPKTIARRVERAILAARARFGAYIAPGPTLYLGFSQGATLAEKVLLDLPEAFVGVALAEGGYNLMRDPRFLQRLHDHGTQRVLLVCGSPACFTTASSRVPAFTQAGVEAQLAGDPLSGHNLNQRMQVALQKAWPAFVHDLDNWRGFADYLSTRH
jgi:predicted esterase